MIALVYLVVWARYPLYLPKTIFIDLAWTDHTARSRNILYYYLLNQCITIAAANWITNAIAYRIVYVLIAYNSHDHFNRLLIEAANKQLTQSMRDKGTQMMQHHMDQTMTCIWFWYQLTGLVRTFVQLKMWKTARWAVELTTLWFELQSALQRSSARAARVFVITDTLPTRL